MGDHCWNSLVLYWLRSSSERVDLVIQDYMDHGVTPVLSIPPRQLGRIMGIHSCFPPCSVLTSRGSLTMAETPRWHRFTLWCESNKVPVVSDTFQRWRWNAPKHSGASVSEYEATSVTPMSCTNSTSINTCALQLSNISWTVAIWYTK